MHPDQSGDPRDQANLPMSDDRPEAEVDARLAAIVESSDDAIVSKTLDGVIRTWNDGAARIFGYSANEVIGKPINIIIPPDRQDEETQILERIRAGKRVDHFETVRRTKDGRDIDVSVTISPVRDVTGRIVGASKVARDITEQRQIQRELEQAKREAEAANRAKDQFLSVLSHELRTPLTPVLAELSFLESEPTFTPDMRAHIAMIRRNVETEARLVDDLLDLTRIARGKMQLQMSAVDAHAALRDTVRMFTNETDAKGIAVTLALRAKQHHVWADLGRLGQVFLNLLSNAVKFTPQNGSIVLRTSNERSGELTIEVRDSGVGMESEMLQRLFNPFEQEEEGRRFGGLGLGLSIARSLLQMHRGTIQAHSEGRDRGSEFILTLPAVLPPMNGTRSAVPPEKSQLLAHRVLLVEDHADTRRVLERLLKSYGCIVTPAASVREAVELAERGTFDLLISDIGLPDGSGTEIIQQLKARGDIPAIALSGFGQDEDIRRSHEAGFSAHLVKPINVSTLKETIRKVAR
jgi:PAS domain S-box-containing protein